MACAKNFFNKAEDLLLCLDAIKEDLTSTTVLREGPFRCELTLNTVCYRYVWHNQHHILFDDEPVFVEVVPKFVSQKSYLNLLVRNSLHIKSQLDFNFKQAVKNFEHSKEKFLKVDIATAIQVHNCLHPFSYDAWKLKILKLCENE